MRLSLWITEPFLYAPDEGGAGTQVIGHWRRIRHRRRRRRYRLLMLWRLSWKVVLHVNLGQGRAQRTRRGRRGVELLVLVMAQYLLVPKLV
jgi:hypothetical protein